MDRVGVEPTTSASFLGLCSLLLSKMAAYEGEFNYCSNPTQSTLAEVILCLVSRIWLSANQPSPSRGTLVY